MIDWGSECDAHPDAGSYVTASEAAGRGVYLDEGPRDLSHDRMGDRDESQRLWPRGPARQTFELAPEPARVAEKFVGDRWPPAVGPRETVDAAAAVAWDERPGRYRPTGGEWQRLVPNVPPGYEIGPIYGPSDALGIRERFAWSPAGGAAAPAAGPDMGQLLALALILMIVTGLIQAFAGYKLLRASRKLLKAAKLGRAGAGE